MTVYPFRDDSVTNFLPDNMCIHRLGLNIYFDEFNYLVQPVWLGEDYEKLG